MAELYPIYVNSVVAIGIESGSPGSREWVGTGFLVNELVKGDNGNLAKENEGSWRFNTFLVTNRHIFDIIE